MRLARTAALLGVALGWYVVGPVALLLALGALALPRVRAWLRPTWRVCAGWMGAVLLLAGLVVVVPDGWLPLPAGAGVALTPSYLGRPARAAPVALATWSPPGLAAPGRAGAQAWAAGAVPGPGPLGDSVEVDSAWYGLQRCSAVAFDGHDRPVLVCADGDGPVLRVLDPDSLRTLAEKALPAGPQAEGRAWRHLCRTGPFHLDAAGRAVLATADRRLLVVRTADADGEADLTTEAAVDLSGAVPAGDCVVSLLPGPGGGLWWVTHGGLVGTATFDGRVAALALEGRVTTAAGAGRDGALYVVTDSGVHRLQADAAGGPVLAWRTAYERGAEQKKGQLDHGSGTPPTLLPGGVLAFADNSADRVQVVFLRTADGSEMCRRAVLTDGGATQTTLAAVDGGVLVAGTAGYTGPWRTALGRSTPGGVARVDHAGGRCEVRWTSAERVPSSGLTVSLATGLAYGWTKPRSWWGVDAWYLSALDVRTGRTRFAVRAGSGPWRDNNRARIALGPDGAAYLTTVAGVVRIRDRR